MIRSWPMDPYDCLPWGCLGEGFDGYAGCYGNKNLVPSARIDSSSSWLQEDGLVLA